MIAFCLTDPKSIEAANEQMFKLTEETTTEELIDYGIIRRV